MSLKVQDFVNLKQDGGDKLAAAHLSTDRTGVIIALADEGGLSAYVKAK